MPRHAPAISTASAEPDPTAQRPASSGFKPMDWLARPPPRDSVASTSCRLLQRCGAVRALTQHHAIAATTQQLVERGLRSFLVHAGLGRIITVCTYATHRVLLRRQARECEPSAATQ